MAFFHYKAALPGGDLVEGRMEADDRETVIRRLQSQGQIPIRADEIAGGRGEAEQARPGRRRGRVGRRELGVFTLELSTLLEAGLPLERALGILTELAENQAVYEMIGRLRSAVRGGDDLSEAMAAEPAIFFPLYVNLVRAGEAGGAMDQALARLSEFMERARDLRDAVISALIYPLILIVLACAALAVILTFVVPKFTAMFEGAGQELPLLTAMVVTISDVVREWWWAIGIGAVVFVIYARYLLRQAGPRLAWDRFLLGLPLAGDLVRKLEAARFSRALGTLLTNGVSLLTALGIAQQIVGNHAVGTALANVSESVREGKGMARPILEARAFPMLACHMLQVGEETGQLDAMLLKLADIYDREVRASVARLVTVLEPAIIVALGLVIALVILSVVIPMLQINEFAF